MQSDPDEDGNENENENEKKNKMKQYSIDEAIGYYLNPQFQSGDHFQTSERKGMGKREIM